MPKNPDPSDLARNASNAIRELNHATIDLASIPYAGEVSRTVLALIELVDRLPQSLDQLADGLRAVEARGGIRLDHDADVHQEVLAALKGLSDANAALGPVSKALGAASAPLFHMGAPYTPDDDDDEDD